MKSKINQLLIDIKKKKEDLMNEMTLEYEKLKEKYWFTIKWRKIIFNKDVQKKNKREKKPILESIFGTRIRELLSAPFIYSMIIPAIIFDLFLTIYHKIAFKLYKIPYVIRKDYIIYDRKELDYLNIIQKINCLYCSYVNWLLAYAVEIAWRTERYWCPIKASRKMKWWHDWQEYFADYGDAEWYKSITYRPEIGKDFEN